MEDNYEIAIPPKRTVIVNMFGGPGCGKSTMAAYLFSMLKWMGMNVELVREYAKDIVWEGNIERLNNQVHIFGEQLHRLNILLGKVNIIITDSPILLSVIYDRDQSPEWKKIVVDKFSEMQNINFFIHRPDIFNPYGRIQTEIESIEIDRKIQDLLKSYEFQYTEFDSTEESAKLLVDSVIRSLAIAL